MANNNDWHTPGLAVQFPFGAGPGQARIVIGDPASGLLPADLIARYASLTPSETVISALVFFQGASGAYFYLVLTTTAAGAVNLNLGGRTSDTAGSAFIEIWSWRLAFAAFGMASTIGRNNTGFNLLDIVLQNGNLTLNSGGTITPVLTLADTASMSLQNTAAINLSGTSIIRVQSGTTLQIDVGSAFTVDGVSMPRGRRDRQDSTANTAAIGAEAVVFTSAAVTFVNGRAYEVRWTSRLTHSAAQVASVRVRQTNLAGASLVFWQRQVLGIESSQYDHRGVVKRTAGSNLSSALVLTLAASAGTVTGIGAADSVRDFEIWECGAAADFPNAIAI